MYNSIFYNLTQTKANYLVFTCPIPWFWNVAYSTAYTHIDTSPNDNIKLVPLSKASQTATSSKVLADPYPSVSCDQDTQSSALYSYMCVSSNPYSSAP